MNILSVGFLLLLTVAGSAQQQPEQQPLLRGRVVGPDGKPVSGVRVAQYWSFRAGRPARGTALETDESGRFEGRMKIRALPCALCAYTADGALGCVREFSGPEDFDKLDFRLEPTVRVHGTLRSSKLGGEIPWTNVYLWTLPAKHRIWSCASEPSPKPRQPVFDLRVPPGKYLFYAYGQDVNGKKRELELRADKLDVDLGAVELPATFLALKRGKEVAWTVTAARGVSLQDSQIADFRGKWLFIEFWGYW